MRCPDCSEDMNEGFLRGNGLYFSPNKDGAMIEYPAFSVDASSLKERMIHGCYLPAHYCPSCHLILARRPDPNRPSDWEHAKKSVKRTIKKLKKEDF